MDIDLSETDKNNLLEIISHFKSSQQHKILRTLELLDKLSEHNKKVAIDNFNRLVYELTYK